MMLDDSNEEKITQGSIRLSGHSQATLICLVSNLLMLIFFLYMTKLNEKQALL